jgi:hypothetical protein
VDLVATVADRIKNTRDYHRMSLSGIKRPLAILKQMLLQFVTANGAGFVRANDWVGPFIREPNNRTIPGDVGIYIYASNRPGMRMTGIGAHIDLNSGRGDTVAEFTFWPLGTVLSFGQLAGNDRLTPIHHWTQYPFEHRGGVDLTLSVNPVVSSQPIDFRNETLVLSDMHKTHAPGKRPSEESARSIFDKAIRHSGSQDEKFTVISHPAARR